MAEDKEWKKHFDAIIVAIERSTEPKVMSKREALGFMDLLVADIEEKQEALAEEISDEEEDEREDTELGESADGYLRS